MRTLKSIFTGEVKGKEQEIRNYRVSGSISFMTTWKEFENISRLKESIEAVHQKFPWRDIQSDGSTVEGNMLHIAEKPSLHTNNWEIPETFVSFRLEHTSCNLRRGQLLAYEAYLNMLAQKLAEMKLPRIKTVSSSIHIQAYKEFKVA